jgi:hypothetical protein
MELTGGCLCGAVRYTVRGPFSDSAYCHCRMCQRSAGAPVLAWFTISQANLSVTKGKLKTYVSSAKGRRDFCPDCGTQILFQGEDSNLIDVTTASLDEPHHVPPQFHIWRTSRVEWFDTSDGLPWHDERAPDWTA